MRQFHHGLNALNARRDVIYTPKNRPGFTAWATAFDYGNGRLGLSFKETMSAHDPGYIPAKLEMGEAVGAPVSYCSVECGDSEQLSWRVYMESGDGGRTFRETGRCQLEQGSFCNVGFPDGRILGMDVPRINEDRTGWCDYIEVRESLDGGTTWSPVARLLEGCAPYLWRARRLRDGTVVLMGSLYGTPWGQGRERTTRNTMLPGETYIHKIQTFFMTTRDGRAFDGPHYILPGVGAHEYDMAECPDGRLLFIAGDVQCTPVARQFVERRGGSYINGTLYGIRRGAPQDPAHDSQGGFVPESLVMLPGGLLVGSRRNKPYSCSNDFGENWFELDGVEPSLYQPFMLLTPDGTVVNFGHVGGDVALGQRDMWIGADFFRVENHLPAACTLSLNRLLSEDGSHYVNEYAAVLRAGCNPVAGQTVTFRFTTVWNEDGSYCTASQGAAPICLDTVTDRTGTAHVSAPMFDGIADIHFFYNVDVVFRPGPDSGFFPCDGPTMCEAALTPHRRCRWPHRAYFAEGTLFISPELEKQFPDIYRRLEPFCGENGIPPASLPDALKAELLRCRVLVEREGEIRWLHSVHAPCPLKDVKPMGGGDWYV